MPVILEDVNCCIYCGGPRECLDHVIPFSLISKLDRAGILHLEYLVPSCRECNGQLTDRLFPTIFDRRIFILEYLSNKIPIEEERITWLERTREMLGLLDSVRLVKRSSSLPSHGRRFAVQDAEILSMLKLDESGIRSLKNIRVVGSLRQARIPQIKPELDPIPCADCGDMFTPTRRDNIYCSLDCVKAGSELIRYKRDNLHKNAWGDYQRRCKRWIAAGKIGPAPTLPKIIGFNEKL